MNHNHSQSGGQASHLWLMLLCCLIPIGLILAVTIFGLSLGPLTPYLPFAIVLLCPLLMFFMMRGMGHEHDVADTHHAETTLTHTPNARVVTLTPRESTRTRSAPNSTAAENKSCH